jgi:hypothetical protein
MARVADLAQNKVVNSIILNTQQRINDRQLQISSLQKSQNYAGISSDSNRLVTLEASTRRVEQFLTDNVFVQLRMEAQLNSMDALDSTIDDLKGLFCPSSKHSGLLSLFSNGGSGSSWIDVKPLGVDGSSGGSGWSVS